MHFESTAGNVSPRDQFHALNQFDTSACPYHFEATGFWPETSIEWRKQGLPADISPWEFFKINPIMHTTTTALERISDTVIVPAYFPLFKKEVLRDEGECRVERDGDGIIKRVRKDGGSMPQFLEFPMQQPEDWSAIKPRLQAEDPQRYAGIDQAAAELKNHTQVVRFGVCGCYGYLRNLFGEEKLAYAYYDHPDLIHDMMQTWLKLYLGIADRLCPKISFDYVFIWEDMAFKNGPLIGPQLFSEFMLPYYQQFTSHLRAQHGQNIFCVDSDGNNFPIMDLFIAGGVTMFLPLEIAAGMQPGLVREKYPKLALMGGIDKRELLKDKAAIDREIDSKVPALIKLGGYLPALDHHVPPDIPFENFCYFLEKLRAIR